MGNELQNSIFEAIKAFQNNQESQGTITITCVVVSVVDASIGKYNIQYQGNTFEAVATSPNVTFKEGEQVLVLVPNGDFTKDKIILSSNQLTTANFSNTLIEDLDFVFTTENLINNVADEIALSSYEITSIDNNASTLPNFNDIFKKLLDEQKEYLLSFKVRTDLAVERQNTGNYGVTVSIPVVDEVGNISSIDTTLDVTNMIGSPYRFENYSEQSTIITIPDGYSYYEDGDIAYTYFCYDFTPLDSTQTEVKDIFIRDISLKGIERLPEAVYNGYYLKITPTQGKFFYPSLLTDKELTATLYKDGTIVSTSESLQHFWYRENEFIDIYSDEYSYIGGVGWENLNNKQEIGQSDDGTPIYQYIPGTNKLTIKANDISTGLTYKCLVVVDDETSVIK